MPDERGEVHIRKWGASMKPPVRQVCGACLRSVDLPTPGENDDVTPSSHECPHCGCVMESRPDPLFASEEDNDKTPPGNAFSPISSGSEMTTDWAETWSRGTLGVIGRYQLRERLGEGGFGQVFQAYDPRLDRDVAIKVLKHPNPTERVMQRFFREARAAARLDHHNIVSVFDAGYENGRCWIVYQYISGRPLWWYRNHHPTDHLTSARIIRDLADALDHAHRLGVLHRDLKPANVIMDDQGRPRLTDFGLARRADLDSSLTRDGATVGTPAYMSPEQANGNSKNIDERSDIYSLGVMFFELLHGNRPNDAENAPEPSSVSGSAATQITGRFRRGKVARSTVPASLQRICDKALASATDQRHANARSLADDLDRWLHAQRARTSARHRLALPVAVAASALLLVGLGLVAAFSPLRSRQPQSSNVDSSAPAKIAPLADLAKPEGSKKIESPTRAEQESLEVQAPPAEGSLVANRETRIYHRSDSSCVKHMAERNRIAIESDAAAARDGYRACDKCFRE